MSELKAIRSGEIYNIIEYEDCYRTDDLYYPKSEVDAAIAELKDENRKLNRALWMARAERALSEQYVISNAVLYLENKFNHKFNAVRYELHVWGVVKRKCRAKAKEYK